MGADEKQIDECILHTVRPQVISDGITFIDFDAVLIAAGLIARGLFAEKREENKNTDENSEPREPAAGLDKTADRPEGLLSRVNTILAE